MNNDRTEYIVNNDRKKAKDKEDATIVKKNVHSNQIVKAAFQEGEVVWAKIRGHPFWPATIECFHYGRTQMIDVRWFNDYRKTKLYTTQLQNFFPNYDSHKHLFEHHVGLECAVKEALIYIGHKKFKK